MATVGKALGGWGKLDLNKTLANGAAEKALTKMGSELGSIQNQFLEEVSKPVEQQNQGKIQSLQMKMQSVMRTMTAVSEMMRSLHEMFMALIRNLRLN